MLHDGDKRKSRLVAPKSDEVSCVYDLLVFIGRFQPLHKGHQEVIEKARKLSKKVLVIVGSAGKVRSLRNPFTFEERAYMIKCLYPDVIVEPISDSAYDDTRWITDAQEIVKNVCAQHLKIKDPKIGLIGCEKDHTSYYLKLFPQWSNESVPFISPINATAIREMFLEEGKFNRWEMDAVLEDEVTKFMLDFMEKEEYANLVAQRKFIYNYIEQWGEGPHLTADALVEVGGHILLIRRGKEYGHGLYALPGGFLQKNERFQDGMIRELKEETRLKVPAPVLLGSMVSNDVFDMPHRSDRGRIITQAYHIKLMNETSLPEVRGSDDADWAGWVQISDLKDGTLKESDFFEDHYAIIQKILHA